MPALRHPLSLAHAVATVDRVAGGRFVLGLAAGWVQQEFDALGIPFGQRVGRLLEAVEICRTVWRASSESGYGPGAPGVSFTGRYWSFDDVRLFPPPARPEGPPVWLGGSSQAAARRAGRRFDGWLPTAPTPEAFAESWAWAQEAAGEAGRGDNAVTPAAYLSVNLDPGPGRRRPPGTSRRTTGSRSR